jgi:hypothetical protein
MQSFNSYVSFGTSSADDSCFYKHCHENPYDGIERDNQVASASIRFIDAQLIDIVDSLHLSGERLQDFRSKKQAIDIGYQAEKVYSKLESLEAEKAKLLVKKRYFNYLTQSLQSKTSMNDLVSPLNHGN